MLLLAAACLQVVTETLEEYGDEDDEIEKAKSGVYRWLRAVLFSRFILLLLPCSAPVLMS
jgi:hypothetical protein